jgi:hypothetical protein
VQQTWLAVQPTHAQTTPLSPFPPEPLSGPPEELLEAPLEDEEAPLDEPLPDPLPLPELEPLPERHGSRHQSATHPSSASPSPFSLAV